MTEFFGGLLSADGFPPRWYCGQWTPFHGWLYILSDLGIWSAYLAIPCVLGYFLARRRNIPFRSVLILFVAFIFCCGTTHLLDAILFWWPGYRLSAAVRFLTAVVSWVTVAALVPTLPKLLAFRDPRELEAEIAERKRAEEGLRASEERFRLLVEGVEEYAIFTLDAAGRVVSWNGGAERITGYTGADIVGRHVALFYSPEDVEAGKPQNELAVAAATGTSDDEGWRVRKDGRRFWANVVVTALRDATDRVTGFSKVTRDITARKRAADELRDSLAEKQVLLREVHHRVKNNLQVICSLLDMQMRAQKTPEAAEAFREAQDRVRSMALVHERLYQTELLSAVDLAAYVRDLVGVLRHSYATNAADVEFDLDLEPVHLSVESAVPCGLVVNELVSNCLKHAFPAGGRGTVRVTLRPRAGGVEFSVADDGRGLPAAFDLKTAETFGLRLIAGLVGQLHGTAEVERTGGTLVRIVFPLPEREPT